MPEKHLSLFTINVFVSGDCKLILCLFSIVASTERCSSSAAGVPVHAARHPPRLLHLRVPQVHWSGRRAAQFGGF